MPSATRPLPVSAETRFVLATAGGAGAVGLRDAASRDGLRWGALIRVATHERAVIRVQASLVAEARVPPPPPVAAALEAMALANRVRMGYLAHRLDETVAALTDGGIPVVLLKGAAVGTTVYRSIAERQMGDLDLLVPVELAGEARRVALRGGWLPSEHEARGAFYAEHYHLPPLRDAKVGDVWLELHTGLLPAGHPYDLMAADVWSAAQPARPGHAALVPSAAHQVLHLCMHFGWAHMMSQGAWQAFSDLQQLVERGNVDWPALVREARLRRASNVCFWALHLARRVGGVAVPPEAEEALRPRRSRVVLEALARHLSVVIDPIAAPCPSGRIRRGLWRAAMRDDIGGRRVTEPWEREHLFPLAGEGSPAASRPAWLVRHLRSAGDYLRYVRRLMPGH
jgi:hypothetical protein